MRLRAPLRRLPRVPRLTISWHGQAMYSGLRAAYWLCGVLPLPLLYRAANAVGTLLYLGQARRRALASANLRRVMPAQTPPAELRRRTLSAFRQATCNYVDILTLGHLSGPQVLERITIEGIEHLIAAQAQGRGAILVSPHIGNMDVVVQYLALKGYPITIPVERVAPESLFQFLCRLRTRQGVHLVPIGPDAMRDMLAALRRGDLIGILADRDRQATGIVTSFFGAPTRLPAAPVLLALRSGAPIVLAHAVRQPGGRVLGKIYPPIRLDRAAEGGMQGAIERGMATVATLIERPIRDYPDQWAVFHHIWTETVA